METKKQIRTGWLIMLLFITASFCNAQSWQWATSCGKWTNDEYGTIATDNSGNIYMTGYYGGIGVFGTDTLIQSGWYGGPNLPVMFCKLAPSGTFQWTRSIIGPESSSVTASVATNKNLDNVYFYGQFIGDITIGGNNLHSNSGQIFLFRFDPDGNCMWAIQAGGNGNDYAQKACVDKAGNIYVAGITYDTAYFDSIKVVGNYIAKYNENGQCQWAKSIGHGFFYSVGLTTDDNQIIFIGNATVNIPFYFDSFLLDPSASILIIGSFGADGDTQWAKIEGDGPIDRIINSGFDNNSNFYVSGSCAGSFSFGNDTIINHTGGMELFLVKFDNFGNPIWSRASSGYNRIRPTQLTVSSNNNIYLTGSISREHAGSAITYFGSYPMIVGNSSMKTEMYLVGYDENGNCIGVAQAPTDGISEPLKGGTSVAVDPEGYCIVAGQFKNTTWFGEDTLTSMGERDIFLAKYGPFYGLGTDDRKTEYNLHIYANPNTGTCNISIPTEFINEKNLTLQIFDQLGKLVQQAPVVIINGNIRLDIEARATGVYNAVLSNGIKSYSGRIIVM